MKRFALLAMLLLVVAGCQPKREDRLQRKEGEGPLWTAGAGFTEAAVIDDIVVLAGQSVAVHDRTSGRKLWDLPGPFRKVRVAKGSVVVHRADDTVEVRDLTSGVVRRSVPKVATLGITWTVLLTSNALCKPDCLVRATDLNLGRELWRGPRAWTGAAMVEPGEPLRSNESGLTGPLLAPEPNAAALRTLDSGVEIFSVTTGERRASIKATSNLMALGSEHTFLQWTVQSCQGTLSATTGDRVWEKEFRACPGTWRPAIAGKLLAYEGIDAKWRVVMVDSGTTIWTGEVGTRWVGMDDRVILAHGPNGLSAFEALSGRHLWTVKTPAAPIDRVVVNDGFLAYSMRGQVVAHSVGTGEFRRVVDASALLGLGDGALVVDSAGVKVYPVSTG